VTHPRPTAVSHLLSITTTTTTTTLLKDEQLECH